MKIQASFLDAEQRAFKRYSQAVQERDALQTNELTKQEQHDAMVLSSSAFAFWAGRGYRTFHLRNCPKLKCVSDLFGFTMYSDAVKAGYKPCRICGPSIKDSMPLTIPINNHVRTDDSVEILLSMCKERRMEVSYKAPILHVKTVKACWRIDLTKQPILIEHKPNGAHGYHQQHRMFLSYTDAILYIARHDKQSMTENEPK